MQQDFVYIFLIVSFVITCIFLLLAYVLSPKELSFEKVSVYECGFEPFGEIVIFNVQFFIVGLLFMILDLEFAFIFPWVSYLGILSVFSFYVMFFFLLVLIVGFIYEWKKGALDWV